MELIQTTVSGYVFLVSGLSDYILNILVGPSPPDVTIMVDGSIGDTNSVIAGQDVVIECNATGGNPTPNVTITINGDKAGDTNIATTKHSLTVGEDQPNLNISCRAENKVSAADSDLQSLQLFCKFSLLLCFVSSLIM